MVHSGRPELSTRNDYTKTKDWCVGTNSNGLCTYTTAPSFI